MKSNKLIYIVFISFIASIIVFIGCQQEESPAGPNDNGAYLSFSPNVDFDNLTKGDWEVISRAFTRINLRENEDGLFEIPYKSGAEINMSDELFGFFEDVLERSNAKILSGVDYNRIKIRNLEEDVSTNADCVARSIAFATGMDYDEVSAYIIERYGRNSVPSSDFYSVMNHFCNGAQVGLSMFNGMDIAYNSSNKYVIVIGAKHAVNVLRKDGDKIAYWDPQANDVFVCSPSSITHVYEIR